MPHRRRPLTGWRAGPCAQGAVAFVLYLVLAAALVGRRALADPGGVTIGRGPDVQIFVWGLRWWPYALGHGLDPFVSRLLWPPAGASTLWTTTVPGLAVIAAPVTLTLGPLVAWNVLCVLAPATAAWTAYLLCRALHTRPVPACVGGLLFGFSAFEQAQGLAHLQLTACALVPLAARELVRAKHGRTGGRQLAVRLGALAALQALISVEVLVTLVAVAALTGLGRFAVCPAARRPTVALAAWSALGLLASLPITGPLLVEMLRQSPPHGLDLAASYSLDPLNLIVPTRVTLLGGGWAAPLARGFGGNLAEQDGYLGLPALAVAAAFLWRRRGECEARTLACALLVALVLSLGARLRLPGGVGLPLAGALLAALPPLRDALPARLALFSALVVAVIVAQWLSDCRAPRRRVPIVTALVLLAIVPAPAVVGRIAHAPASGPARSVAAGATVISLPFWDVHDRGLELQAEAGLRFALIDRWIQDTPPSLRRFARTPALYGGGPPDLRRVLCDHHIDAALIWPGASSRRIATELDAPPPRPGGVVLARLRCGDAARRG